MQATGLLVCLVGEQADDRTSYLQSVLLVVLMQGVVYEGRDDLTPDNYLSEVAVATEKRTLQEAIEGADVFLGLSVSDDAFGPLASPTAT